MSSLVTQSILVPISRAPSVAKARVIAARYGATPGGKVERQKNFFAFRQMDPALIQPGTFVSFKSAGGVVLRRGEPIARENPTENRASILWLLAGAGAVFIGAQILSRPATASAPTPAPTPAPPPTRNIDPYANQSSGPIVRQPIRFNPYTTASVRILQQQLHTLGYNITYPVTGVYDSNTRTMVDAFVENTRLDPNSDARMIFLAVDTVYARNHDPSRTVDGTEHYFT